jgi:putative ABC transport system ATP-binding protein
MPCPLQVQAVQKHFRQGPRTIAALDGIDLDVRAGEFVAIMGASGSGKSTLLHAMAGLTDVDAGRVLVEGQDLAQLSDASLTDFRRRRIGLVFQAFNLIPVLTVEDNIRLPATSAVGLDDKVDALLGQLGLTDRRTHRPQALSGGEQQRTAIARALVADPAILLLDEPTGSLDSVAGQELCQTLRTLCDEQRRTIVMVTHEASVALWADRVVMLRDGQAVDSFATEGCSDALALAHRYRESTLVKRPHGGRP